MVDLVQPFLAVPTLQREIGGRLAAAGQEPTGHGVAGQRTTHGRDDPCNLAGYANDSPTGTSTRTAPE